MMTKYLLPLGLCLFAPTASAEEHALVVGINDYRAFPSYSEKLEKGETSDLLGAVNDANLIAASLQRAGVRLPEERVLLNASATRAGFLQAWNNMKADATPGDTLIITFAGHGGQEVEASQPFDEADGRDEILMFHDFDPASPGVGRITDDELFQMMEDASEFEIVWVMDSCHSGGLVRSLAPTVSRFGGLVEGTENTARNATPIRILGDGSATPHPHVTQILATQNDVLLVSETRIDGEMHGALSWHFAEALQGLADRNEDQTLSRGELRDFLTDRVSTRMNRAQEPQILPNTDRLGLIGLGLKASEVSESARTEVTDNRITVAYSGARPPGIDIEETKRVPTGAALTFVSIDATKWDVLNHTGDRISSIDLYGSDEASIAGWAESAADLVMREQALMALEERSAFSTGNIALELENGNDTLVEGDIARLNVETNPMFPHLTMFNVTSNGKIQALFPTQAGRQPEVFSLDLEFDIIPPFGADTLVAVACESQPIGYQSMLRTNDGQPASATLFTDPAIADCDVAAMGLFTDSVK